MAQLFSLGVMPRFMKYHTSLITAALLASLFTGCSKHPPAAPKVTNLGVVEVSDGSTNRIDIGGGKVCVVKSFILKDQKATVDGKEIVLKGQKVALMIDIEQTDASGVVHTTPGSNLMASPDQTVGFSDGAISISLKPHIKQ